MWEFTFCDYGELRTYEYVSFMENIIDSIEIVTSVCCDSIKKLKHKKFRPMSAEDWKRRIMTVKSFLKITTRQHVARDPYNVGAGFINPVSIRYMPII